MALLDQLPTSAIAEIVQRLNPRLYIDFVQYLPAEICLKILACLDPASLVNVMRTCRAWYHLAIDRKLWERLYLSEGWKALQPEIDAAEARLSFALKLPHGGMRRSQNIESHNGKSTALLPEEYDVEMTDSDRLSQSHDEAVIGSSSAFASSTLHLSLPESPPPLPRDFKHNGSLVSSKGKAVDRTYLSPDSLAGVKRKEPGGSPELNPSPDLPAEGPTSPLRSTLWAWDSSSSRYRINWKYLYNMRRRLESNWELGKYSTFQLPHPLHPEEGHQECVYTLQFDARYLVSGSRDQTIRIWDMRTLRLAHLPLTGHTGSVLCLQFDADPDEDILVSGSSDSNVFIWRFSTGQLMQKITNAHQESVLNVRFDKRIIVTSSKDKTIKIFNRRPLRYGDLGYRTPDSVVSPVPGHVKRYGLEPDLAQELPIREAYSLIGRLEGHGAAVNAIQVRDRTIVSVSGDRHIKVWDWPDQVCTQTIPAHDKGIACVEFDGRRIVSGSSDYEVCIFDAPTGLKVAQLRGHAHLVRTVQAGFGDLPYSKDEDEADAKAVDAEYFRAVEAGEINHDSERRSRRSRRANAGSSRPSDVQAFGAKVPPGGGGGRKYGRIVSGSYDQSIIIWRRDKEGVWKPAHHLRQEEAAATAQRQMSAFARPANPRQPWSGDLLPQRRIRTAGPTLRPGAADGSTGVDSGQGSSSAQPTDDPGPPQDAADLQMTHTDQVMIMGEVSPHFRPQTRQAPATALSLAQHRDRAARSGPGTTASPLMMVDNRSTGAAAGPSRASGYGSGAGQSLAGGGSVVGGSHSHHHPLHHHHHQGAVERSREPSVSMGGMREGEVAAAATTTTTTVASHPQAVPLPGHSPGHGQPPPPPPPHTAQQIAVTEVAPARIFKLQFDARKIICCSQAPVIVGWDFCNGEAELEETARFFATVD